jgi:hypothetical protein
LACTNLRIKSPLILYWSMFRSVKRYRPVRVSADSRGAHMRSCAAARARRDAVENPLIRYALVPPTGPAGAKMLVTFRTGSGCDGGRPGQTRVPVTRHASLRPFATVRCMVDVRQATQILVMAGGRHPLRTSEMSKELIADGAVHVDFGEPEQVFLLTVTAVPRRQLLHAPQVVAEMGDVEAWLVGLEIANHVTLRLEGRGPGADQALQTYREAHETWLANPQTEPPDWPATHLPEILQTVTDDVGTHYTLASAAGGGERHPWRYVSNYLPVPPGQASSLRLSFEAHGQTSDVEVPLIRGTAMP